MSHNTAIVTTTVNVPSLLERYCRNARKHGHEGVTFIVVGDEKTPPRTRAFCAKLAAEYPYPVVYLGMKEQARLEARFPKLAAHVPRNTPARRCYGLLEAYIRDFDVIISIDDDSFTTDQDFVGHHAVVGSRRRLPLVESSTGWYNVCEALIEEEGLPFYHRGYPWSERGGKRGRVTRRTSAAHVVVNAGLWLGDPDVDATSRLFWPLRVRAMRRERAPRFGLRPGTWSPFNSQNTALAREALPAYFLSPANGRFSDIWAGYILCRIAEHLGHVIAYGYPLARHERNPHDLWADLEQEKTGAQATEPLVALLRQARLRASSYHHCLTELCAYLRSRGAEIARLPRDQAAMLTGLIDGLEIWNGCFSGAAD